MQPSCYKWLYLIAGIVLRIGLIAFARYQDSNYEVPYTDVDYSVFSDAAQFVINGCPLSNTAAFESEADLVADTSLRCARGFLPAIVRFLLLNDPINRASRDRETGFHDDSPILVAAGWCYSIARPLFKLIASIGDPYARPTYRYTPFLALLLSPIHLLSWPDFGKYIFAAADVLCAVLMWALLDARRAFGTKLGAHVHLPGLLWLLNPIPAQISTRGSSEGLVGLTVLLFLYFLLSTNPEAPVGAVPLHKSCSTEGEKSLVPTYRPLVPEAALPFDEWSLGAYISPIVLGVAVHLKMFPVIYGIPVVAHLFESTKAAYDPVTRRKLRLLTKHAAGIKYGLVAFCSFMLFNLLAWSLWGSPFISNTFTYHLKRQDHRHNFSPYFLGTYLSSGADTVTLEGLILNSPLLSFGPQMLLVSLLGWKLGAKDVVAAMMAQTMAFVAFNKVCTSQYFLWFLWLVPVVLPSLSMGKVDVVIAVAVWVGGQAVWLSQAFLLEFKGQEVFAKVWASGLLLLGLHTLLLVGLIKAWAESRVKSCHVK